MELELELELEGEVELELELPFRTPPAAPPAGEVLFVAFFAKAANASNVLPEFGALIAPTMPSNVSRCINMGIKALTRLAVIPLATVEPNWLCVFYGNLEARP